MLLGHLVVFMLPYVEQQSLYNAFNTMGNNSGAAGYVDGELRYSGAANVTVTSARVSSYLCPSDQSNAPLSATVGTSVYPIVSNSYAVNFGTTSSTQRSEMNGVRYAGAPFTDMGSPTFAGPGYPTTPADGYSVVRLPAIQDGLSNTMLVAEVIIGQGSDLRGFSHWFAGAAYESFLPPNSTQPDVMQDASYCMYPFQNNPPCTSTADITFTVNASRSRHPGGINTTMGDGSVRFVKNSVNLGVWRALSSTRGGEVISADAY